MLCEFCGSQKTLMVDETICIDCFEEMPHEEDEAVCSELLSGLTLSESAYQES